MNSFKIVSRTTTPTCLVTASLLQPESRPREEPFYLERKHRAEERRETTTIVDHHLLSLEDDAQNRVALDEQMECSSPRERKCSTRPTSQNLRKHSSSPMNLSCGRHTSIVNCSWGNNNNRLIPKDCVETKIPKTEESVLLSQVYNEYSHFLLKVFLQYIFTIKISRN